MTHTPPIACSLPAAEYRDRRADIGQVVRDALLHRRPIAGGARLTFDGRPEVRDRLEALIAAESECCPFLTMTLETIDGRLVLDVTGPEAAAPIVAELCA